MPDEETPNSSTNQPDIPEAYREQVNAVYHAWQDGDLSFAKALKQLEAMQAAAKNDPIKLGALANTLGIMHGYRSQFDESVAHFEEARTHFVNANVMRRVVSCDLNIGETYRLRGNYTRARLYFHRAYEEGVKLNSISTQTTALSNEGQMWLTLNSIEKARETLEKALHVSEQPWTDTDPRSGEDLNRRDNQTEIHAALAQVNIHEGELTAAWEHAKTAYDLAQTLDRPLRLGFAYRALAEVLTATSNSPDEAFAYEPDQYYKSAIKAFKQVKAEGEVAKTQFAQAKSMAKRGKKRDAQRLLQQAMLLFTKLGMTNDAAKASEAQLDIM